MKVQLMGVVFDPKQILAISPIQPKPDTIENESFFVVFFKAGTPQKFSSKQPDELKRSRENLIGLWDEITTPTSGKETKTILLL